MINCMNESILLSICFVIMCFTDANSLFAIFGTDDLTMPVLIVSPKEYLHIRHLKKRSLKNAFFYLAYSKISPFKKTLIL